jgi:hypothetical protein
MTTMIEAARKHFSHEVSNHQARYGRVADIAFLQIGPKVFTYLEDDGKQVSFYRYEVTVHPDAPDGWVFTKGGGFIPGVPVEYWSRG